MLPRRPRVLAAVRAVLQLILHPYLVLVAAIWLIAVACPAVE